MVGDFARGHREGVVGRIRHGFSLLEVMVVVVIVGILSTMAVPNLGKLAVHFRGGGGRQGRACSVYAAPRTKTVNRLWLDVFRQSEPRIRKTRNRGSKRRKSFSAQPVQKSLQEWVIGGRREKRQLVRLVP